MIALLQQSAEVLLEAALPAGYPLSGTSLEQQFWQRIALSAAVAQAKHQG